MFGSIPQPAYMPCEECGASVPVGARDEHVCSEQRRLAYELCKVRAELAAFEGLFAAYLESPHGRFELWYAERERRRKQR
jgi:predicted nucleic acid-binding Zn ribbon protein